jgi:hypothetical protein
MTVMATEFWDIISCALVHMYSKLCLFSALFSGHFALNVYFVVEFTAVFNSSSFDTAALLAEEVSNVSARRTPEKR